MGWRADAPLFPFVSSEVETPIDVTPSPRGISTSLDANGVDGRSGRFRPVAGIHTFCSDKMRRFKPRSSGERAWKRARKRAAAHSTTCAERLRSEEHTSELQSLMRNSN